LGGQEFLGSQGPGARSQESGVRGQLRVDGGMLSFSRARSSSLSLRLSRGKIKLDTSSSRVGVRRKSSQRMDDDSSLGRYSLSIENVQKDGR